MTEPLEHRPGVAYRRPGGDPTRLVVEAAGESQLSSAALPRSDWLRVVDPDDRDQLREALDADEVDVTYRVTVAGESAWVHERGVRDESGDVVGYLFAADDRAEGRRQLERQRERLEEFASVVSHDLRNPLSVAVGNLELAREFDGEEATERLDRAHEALDYMDDLISELLVLAREGRSVEETATVGLRSVLDRAWRTVGAPEEVVLVVDDPLPSIECDRCRLREALENLFRNAIEHGAGDAVELSAPDESHPDFRSEAFGGATDCDPSLRVFVGPLPNGFYVADDGAGIDPAERDAVFDPGHSTDEDGTGFGLSIVERIAEAHGWEVSVTESRDGGVRFEFTGVDVADSEPGEAGSHGGSEPAQGE